MYLAKQFTSCVHFSKTQKVARILDAKYYTTHMQGYTKGRLLDRRNVRLYGDIFIFET